MKVEFESNMKLIMFQYTCFNTSSSYIVLGSTSGSIYLFSRKPCSFIQLIPLSVHKFSLMYYSKKLHNLYINPM